MKANDGFTLNPNVIWMLPPKPVEEDVSELLPCENPDACIESGKLVCFRGEDEFSLKIGGTTYDVSTHFSTRGKESVLEQFKRLILSEKLI
ncbi:transposon-encoded TnpW family protein [Hominenteromicrobium sp.]|uniref:transposon-encoded TnpW family protein n=1 Tax=Hominenteromicrobium sp. TaxID=3073581 RepID=UPI003A92EDA0